MVIRKEISVEVVHSKSINGTQDTLPETKLCEAVCFHASLQKCNILVYCGSKKDVDNLFDMLLNGEKGRILILK